MQATVDKLAETHHPAIPFIIYEQKNGFYLNPEAEHYLNSLPSDRKIGIISIVGKYRTGKSFFVNRVLLNKSGVNCGFTVGPTVNPCTKVLFPLSPIHFSSVKPSPPLPSLVATILRVHTAKEISSDLLRRGERRLVSIWKNTAAFCFPFQNLMH